MFNTEGGEAKVAFLSRARVVFRFLACDVTLDSSSFFPVAEDCHRLHRHRLSNGGLASGSDFHYMCVFHDSNLLGVTQSKSLVDPELHAFSLE